MQNGISVYAGLDYGKEENLALIESAASLGFKRLFTSAQIPEASDDENFFAKPAQNKKSVQNGIKPIVFVRAH